MLLNPQKRQYELIRGGVGLIERADRGVLEVRGADRAAWLNNLVTNVIKTLGRGDGNYAFAVNIKGRVVFDLNMLVLDEPGQAEGRIWLDIDAGWIGDAMKHLNKYTITEDVRLADLTAGLARWAVVGPKAAAVVERLGLGNLTAMPALQHMAVGGEARMVRNDFAGVMTAEFIVPAAEKEAWRGRLMEAGSEAGIAAVDESAVDIVRIESGIPASRRDIDGETVPPETGQIERGISYHKGCYLGQEVIERMRSHGVLPKKLVGLRLACDAAPAMPMVLKRDANEVGRVTSACWSPRLGGVMGLGYVKTAHLGAGIVLAAIGPDGVTVGAELVQVPLID